MQNKILITGGTGRLAAELKKHIEAEFVGIEHWDFTYEVPRGEYDLIVHMGAYTDVVKAEKEANKCFQINAFGTFQIVQTYKDTPLIYISSEYCKNPLGVYALTKQLGEEIVKTHPHHLILRTLFKPNPFPFEYAYEDQMTQGDYIDVVAGILADIIKNWDRKTSELRYLGTERKSIFQLAQKTRPDVKPNSVDDYNKKIGKNLIPKDYE